jgi:hypothetical protein
VSSFQTGLVRIGPERYPPLTLDLLFRWCRVGYGARFLPLLVRIAAMVVLLGGSRTDAAERPPGLPRYDLDLTLDTNHHTAHLRETVTWTNTTRTPTNELVFSFYPNYQVPRGEYLKFAKTLEMLRLQPSLGISRAGPAGSVLGVRLRRGGKQADLPLDYRFDPEIVTCLRIGLPEYVNPGEQVTVELECEYRLPNKQGRLGHYEGVTFLTNSFPVLAFRDDSGWRPMPFVPWHQPWFNEAGVYRARITLPENEVLATPAVTDTEVRLGDGRKTIQMREFTGRDFSVLCSARYREYKTELRLPDGRFLPIRCMAFPEHEFYALELLRIVSEAIPVYSRWFGPYPADQFTITESYFGWNGNECAGLIMIDERVFGMPHLAVGYVEYLVSHETCHQWWYNLIGTNGYSETFMDEGAATYFTHRLLDQKHGKNNPFLNWPDGLKWLPNLNRENYRYAGMYQAIRNNEMHPAAQPLPEYKHLFGLFTGAYDRGSKVFGMIESQMGEAAYFDFLRMLVAKYSWRVLQAADLRRELEAYTGRDWGDFFQKWVYGKGMTDWAVGDVTVEPVAGPLAAGGTRLRDRLFPGRSGSADGYTATVIVRQQGDYLEPTVVGFASKNSEKSGYEVRIPVGMPVPMELDEPRASVLPLGDRTWRITVTLPFAPAQITIDPDTVLLDSNPRNNSWKSHGHSHVTPLYTMLDETDLTSEYAAWNYTFGPWIWGPSYADPWYTRSTMIGLRAGANLPQNFRGGFYSAYRTDFRDVVIGADAVVLGDHFEAGVNWERRIGGPYGSVTGSGGPERASGYFRDIIKPSSSLYLPPIMYQDGFVTYQDNFFPYARNNEPGAVRWDRLAMIGYHFRLNMYTPYWDPETGYWVDLTAATGLADLNAWQGMGQGRIELAGVQQLPEWLGPLQYTRLAGRIVAMGAWPNQGEFFALGGGTLFRGFDLAQRQGNALWVGNAEFRIPLARNIEWDALDHTVGARNLWLAAFYDVGEAFAAGKPVVGVAHALGAGIRLDMSVFSFIERATLRIDFAKTINAATPFQVWFGIQQAF